jgi:two-component system, chemotaxis family, chemotaxis protein CheY
MTGRRMSMKDTRVLVVDDAPEIRKLLRAVLWEMGIKMVEEATNGVEALRILVRKQAAEKKEASPIDLVLCDIHMPEMDGICLLKEMLQREEVGYPAVIMISGDSTADRIVQAAKLGADDFIIKPYTLNVVEEKVRKALGRRKGAGPNARQRELETKGAEG